jgi:hypothetical protein
MDAIRIHIRDFIFIRIASPVAVNDARSFSRCRANGFQRRQDEWPFFQLRPRLRPFESDLVHMAEQESQV